MAEDVLRRFIECLLAAGDTEVRALVKEWQDAVDDAEARHADEDELFDLDLDYLQQLGILRRKRIH